MRERAASMDNGNHISDGIQEASFSDDEDDIPLGQSYSQCAIHFASTYFLLTDLNLDLYAGKKNILLLF